MPTDQVVIAVLRSQAWERAKGELNAMLSAYVSEGTTYVTQFKEADAAVTEFINKIENKGLQE